MSKEKFRLSPLVVKPDKEKYCEILYRNIEDFRRLGYDVKQLLIIYGKVCGTRKGEFE